MFSLPLYQKAAWLTVTLAFWGILLALLVGFLCSVIRYCKIPFLAGLVQAYIELSRNTPLLIQLFFLYYALPKIGLRMTETTCAIVGLTFLCGSYMAESFRAGLEAVRPAQLEAGRSIGLSELQLIRHVVLPQALTSALPSLGANAIFLLKETSIVGAIALPELMHVTQDLIGMYYHTFESLLTLVLAYLALLLPFSFALTLLERRIRHAEFGTSNPH